MLTLIINIGAQTLKATFFGRRMAGRRRECHSGKPEKRPDLFRAGGAPERMFGFTGDCATDHNVLKRLGEGYLDWFGVFSAYKCQLYGLVINNYNL